MLNPTLWNIPGCDDMKLLPYIIMFLILISFSQAALYQNRCWSLTNGTFCVNGTSGTNIFTGVKINASDVIGVVASGGNTTTEMRNAINYTALFYNISVPYAYLFGTPTFTNGSAGVSVSSAIVLGNYSLNVTLTNGTQFISGSIRGATGSSGSDGSNGANGLNGTNGTNASIVSGSPFINVTNGFVGFNTTYADTIYALLTTLTNYYDKSGIDILLESLGNWSAERSDYWNTSRIQANLNNGTGNSNLTLTDVTNANGNYSANYPYYVNTSWANCTAGSYVQGLNSGNAFTCVAVTNGSSSGGTGNVSGLSNENSSGYICLFQGNSTTINTSTIFQDADGDIGIDFKHPSTSLYVGLNQSSRFHSLDTEFMMIGGYKNYLTYTEDFTNAIWVKNNISAVPGITANLVMSPIWALTAEWAVGNHTTSNLSQTYANTETTNMTCSIKMKSENVSPVVCLQINMNQSNTYSTNTNTGPQNCKNITSNWERYAVTRELSAAHINYSFQINIGQYNISLTAAQCEPNTKMPSSYSGPLTSTATTTYTQSIRPQVPIVSASSISATTGTFSSILTSTSWTGTAASAINIAGATGINRTVLGLTIASSTASTAAIPYQNSPMLIFSMNRWTGLVSVTENFSMFESSNNITNTTLFNYQFQHSDNTNHTVDVIEMSNSNLTLNRTIFGNITFSGLNNGTNGYLCLYNGRAYVNVSCP